MPAIPGTQGGSAARARNESRPARHGIEADLLCQAIHASEAWCVEGVHARPRSCRMPVAMAPSRALNGCFWRFTGACCSSYWRWRWQTAWVRC